MIDAQAQVPLRVSTDGTAGPYIMISLDRLDRVREALSRNEVAHWVESDAISLDGKPAIAVINLDSCADPDIVQKILDTIH